MMGRPATPRGLNAAGKAAFCRALEAIGDNSLFVEAARQFAYSVDLEQRIREEWMAAGRPTMHEFGNGVQGTHPYVKMMKDAERSSAAAAKALGLTPESAKRLRIKPGRPLGGGRKQQATPPLLRLSRPNRQAEDDHGEQPLPVN